MNTDILKEIIELMTTNKLSRVKFGDIEVVKDLHEIQPTKQTTNKIKSFEELDEDDQLFNPLGDLNGRK